ncbi:MarR family transcriptional regulator [Duganella sp. LX20W]|uniref:MarR family transcriptional regulator n=1 Tax=Rugamonas brunnea TaxID=2758569 RepID=A0A7W2IAP7_9BURK|nr:MarR family transcriptional regulator [Rugamonas brunnea]MBA5636494.1 MarR family transcriptional regulator [Rugamonas brunnea]
MGKKASPPNGGQPDVQLLAENMRDTIGNFVRAVRRHAGTPSTAQGETLAFLERSGPVSIAAVAENRGVKHQSMRLVIAKLEESGLVALQQDPQDGRGYLVTLTKAGLAETASARAARTQWLSSVLATTMTPDERAILQQALPILQKITNLD